MRFWAAAFVAMLSGFHAASALANAPCTIDASKLAPSDGSSPFSSDTPTLLDAWADCLDGEHNAFMARYADETLGRSWVEAFEAYAVTPEELPAALPDRSRLVDANFFSVAKPVRDLQSRVAALDAADAHVAADLRAYLSYLQIAVYLWDETRVWMMEEAWPGLLRAHARKAAHAQRRDAAKAAMAELDALWQRLNLDLAKEQGLSAAYQELAARVQDEASCVRGLEAAINDLMWRIEILSLTPHVAPFAGDLPEPALPPQPVAPPEAGAACAWSLEPLRMADGQGG